MLAIHYPCATIGHGAKHVILLFFKDIYTNASICLLLLCVCFVFFEMFFSHFGCGSVLSSLMCINLPRG
jgi:hypothetical protein